MPGDGYAEVWVKMEAANPTGSYKDRMALAMIEAAETDGRLRPGQLVVEYTGGSTGSSLAFVCAVKGYPLRIVLSDAFSEEKIRTGHRPCRAGGGPALARFVIYFGGSAVAGIIGWMTIFATIIWPKMKQQPRVQQLKTLTAIHFFRYFATTLLIAGLVSRKLPSGFADPAAFGDLISLGLAYIAFIGLQRSTTEKATAVSGVDLQHCRRGRPASGHGPGARAHS
jgi:hypothetical protein